MREAASEHHAMYIPSGALWGAQDIEKMNELGTLRALCVTMRKHPSSFKVHPDLHRHIEEAHTVQPATGVVLYSGPVRDLCPLAPNNVNTMAAAAMAAPSLGFDGVQARLIADRRLESHVVTVEAVGPSPGTTDDGVEAPPFRVVTTRDNPALPGAVTGSATFGSFLSSLLRARGHETGVYMV